MKTRTSTIITLAAVLFAAIFCGGAAAKESAQALRLSKAPAGAIWVDSLDMARINRSGGPAKAGSYFGGPLLLQKNIMPHGLGVFGSSMVAINLKGAATRFMSLVGITDDRRPGTGSMIFQVFVDGKKIAESPVMRGGDKPYLLSVDVTGAKKLFLFTDSTADGAGDDAGAWGGALLYIDPNAKDKPEPFDLQVQNEPAPKIAHADPDKYGIHGPRVVGTTPGNPFVFLIPATGKGPLTFSAAKLPAGLKLDKKTGIITGSVKKNGKYTVTVSVKGPKGSAKRKLTIVAGKHKLAQTPPMGWNSWNVWGLAVNDQKVRQAADVMINSGLASHGFQYINIDDGWEKNRAPDGTIVTNEKFPDMKATAGYVHSKGLRFGVYSSPGPKTCGGYEASWQHEQQDATSYGKWGVDYLKYDWCSYGAVASANVRADYEKPYVVMRNALDKSGRDVFFSFCQYGMDNVWEWGAEIGGNSWRTTGDINDSWGSMSGIGFSQSGIAKYAGPGHWNDPDMLVVGRVGWGPNVHPTNLSPNEQITHITLWSMLSSPLLIGADMGNLDQFTLDLLTNDDVLDVNQDPLGKTATLVAKEGMYEVWARPLWDGTIAVALFNRFFEKGTVTVKWTDLKLKGKQPVRDLWLQKDIGTFKDSFSVIVPAHGAVMVKIGKPKRKD